MKNATSHRPRPVTPPTTDRARFLPPTTRDEQHQLRPDNSISKDRGELRGTFGIFLQVKRFKPPLLRFKVKAWPWRSSWCKGWSCSCPCTSPSFSWGRAGRPWWGGRLPSRRRPWSCGRRSWRRRRWTSTARSERGRIIASPKLFQQFGEVVEAQRLECRSTERSWVWISVSSGLFSLSILGN